MKLTLPRKETLEAVKACLSVIGSSSTLPILSCLKLEAVDGHVTLTSSNLDRWMQCRVPAEITKPGTICLSAKLLLGILAGGADPTIEVDPKLKVKVTSGGYSFRFPGLKADEFPEIPSMVGTALSVIEISNDDWLSSSRAVAWAASTDSATRLPITGTLISAGEDFHVVATDGRCLSQVTVTESKGFEREIIVPTSTMSAIDLLADADGNLVLRTNGSLLSASCGDRYLVSKLVEATFPNYRQVIPDVPADATRLTVRVDALIDALKRVQIITTAQTPSVVLSVDEAGIHLSSRGADDSGATAMVEATVKGGDKKIQLNPAMLLSPLTRWGADEVDLAIISEMSPVVMTYKSFLFVQMPMRLQ